MGEKNENSSEKFYHDSEACLLYTSDAADE